MNNDFYKNLDSIDDFSKMTIDENYTKIPSDWQVLVYRATCKFKPLQTANFFS